MGAIDYQALVEDAFSEYKARFKGLEDDTFRLAMAAESLAAKRLSEDDYASLEAYRLVAVAESPAYFNRLVTIYETADRHDLLEAAAKPAEWAAQLPLDEHLEILDCLARAGHGVRVLRIWRHFIGKIAEGYWWWIKERNTTVDRHERGLKPKLGSIAPGQCVEAAAEHKETMLEALDMAQPAFERFGGDRDKAWLKLRREEVMAEERTRVSDKPFPGPMTEDLFWDIISTGGETLEEQLDTFPDRLAQYSAKDIKAFGQMLVDMVAAAYREDIWGLAYLMMQGASDDAFAAFRNWLVLQGRATYLATLGEPDQFDVTLVHGTPMAEGLSSLVEQAYELRAGKPMPQLKYPKTEIGEIDEDAFSEMLPNVARKTSHDTGKV